MNDSKDDSGPGRKVSGWGEWSQYVLKSLEKFDERMSRVEYRLRQIEAEQAVLKAKLALYVAAGTAVIVIAAEVVRMILSK